MNENSFFSIVIPVYKVEKYLSECIESVLEQTFSNYEIVLIDDGSPDNCPAICDKYSAEYENIKVIHKTNGGLSDARNEGLKAASGEFVVFLDSDDKLANKDVLSGLASFIKDEDAKLVFCPKLARFSKNIKPRFAQYLQTSKLFPVDLFNYTKLCGSLFSAWLFVTNRQFLLEHNLFFTKGLLHEDMDWIPRLLTATETAVSIFPEKFYLYRFNDESITSTFNKKRFESIEWIINDCISKLSVYNTIKRHFLIQWINMLLYMLFINTGSLIDVNKNLYKECKKKLISLFKEAQGILNFRNKFIFIFSKTVSFRFINFIRLFFKHG